MNFVETGLPFRVFEDRCIAGFFEIPMAQSFGAGHVDHNRLLTVAQGMCKIVRFRECDVAKPEFLPQKAAVGTHREHVQRRGAQFSRG